MRGKAQRAFHSIVTIGITPAYAGKSACRSSRKVIPKDHPRLCGEKVTVAVPLIPYSGSPPPMRGKDFSTSNSTGVPRITPAYAGKSVSENSPL